MRSISVVLGRFQPVHIGHRQRIQAALDNSSDVIVVIGSAERAPTIRNPFRWQERAEMIRRLFSPSDNERLHLLPLRDYFDTDRWAKTLAAQVKSASQEILATSSDLKIHFCGNFDNDSLSNLTEFAAWTFSPCKRNADVDGVRIREQLLAAISDNIDSGKLSLCFQDSLKCLESMLPESTSQWLLENFAPQFWSRLSTEWQAVQRVKSQWSSTPYPPIFVTVDSVIRCCEKILLVRRKHAPGEGLWALPGGFVEAGERIFQAARRELGEETQLWLSEEQSKNHLRASAVFDHPHRSLLGRVVTHAFYFDLGDIPLPPVQATDDAAAAAWIEISQLPSMEPEFHDDHFFILNHFLGLL